MLRFLRASAENRRWNFSTAVAKSTTSPAMIFRQLVSVVPGPRVHEPPQRFFVRLHLRLCGQGQKKRSSPAQGELHLSLLRRCPRRKPTARVARESNAYPRPENSSIFSLRWKKSARTFAFAGVFRSRRRKILPRRRAQPAIFAWGERFSRNAGNRAARIDNLS